MVEPETARESPLQRRVPGRLRPREPARGIPGYAVRDGTPLNQTISVFREKARSKAYHPGSYAIWVQWEHPLTVPTEWSL